MISTESQGSTEHQGSAEHGLRNTDVDNQSFFKPSFNIFRQQQLKFNPPIEEIRMKYYSQLKKFITMPFGFHGIADSSASIFESIVDRYTKIIFMLFVTHIFNFVIFLPSNASKFTKLFSRAENIFGKLAEILTEWDSRVALGTIDMEKTIQETVKTAQDWEANFRSSKSWSQQIAKLNW